MEYTVQQLAKLAGVSARTLRWYDKTGLLRPGREENGYRVYTVREVDRLQQILFYREMGFELARIGELLMQDEADRLAALLRQKQALTDRQRQIERLIATVDQTIASIKEDLPMTDKEKFEGFQKEQVEQNEKQYGAEVRAAYGDEAMDAANRKRMSLSQAQYTQMTELAETINRRLAAAVAAGADPAGDEGRQIAQLHKDWLLYTWNFYTPAAHAALAQGYVADERFTAYYDAAACPGAAVFLRDAVCAFCAE